MTYLLYNNILAPSNLGKLREKPDITVLSEPLCKRFLDDSLSKLLKGTVRVISSDPSCKDSKARFITIPLNLINNVEDIGFFLGLKVSNFYNS